MTPPPAPLSETQEQKIASTEEPENIPIDKRNPKTDLEVQTSLEELPQAQFENLFITYSTTGGYIEAISIDNPSNVLPFRKIGFAPGDEDKKYEAWVGPRSLVFRTQDGAEKEFVFDRYRLDIKLGPTPPSSIVLFYNILQDSMLDQRYQEIFYSHDQSIKRTNPKKLKAAAYRNVSFAGSRERYYCFSLFRGSYDIEWAVGQSGQGQLQLLSPESQISMYVGPQTSKSLQEYDLQGIIYYGFFHAIGMMMIKLLYFFYSVTKNWGLSIIGFAVFIYGCLFPFTMKSTKAMRKMQDIQPELEALKVKYKDNPQKFSKEQVALFKEHKVNPIGGCLPLFFQFPIFIALYQVLFRFVELKGASFLWIQDLSLPDKAFALPFKIPFLGNYLNILPILIMIVGLIQQKVTTSKSSSSEQKSMGLFFSVFLGVIFYNFPSALVLYWFVQNLLTFAYQLRISKTSPLKCSLAS
ncbi:MAG: membrane protein insertase YidC [Candidatus Omnitrophica bacterium]|nr:membrane protein insertase YidC [Candidatus Omnitrophota bacterium]